MECKCKIYEGKSHTQPLIEDPLKGGQDCLMEDILSIVSFVIYSLHKLSFHILRC